MPYIKKEDRIFSFEDWYRGPDNPGELNYIITLLCRMYFEKNGSKYQQINDIIGALEACKLEFYRRLVAPYEDTKIKENGDVY